MNISCLIRVRRMQEEDIEAVLEIESGLTGRRWTHQSFRESLQRPEAHFYIAETVSEPAGGSEDKSVTAESRGIKTGQICGYCCLYSILGEAEIVNVAVAPVKRKQGIGWQMLRRVLDTEKQEGITMFVLEVRSSNFPAQRLYEKAGFTNCGIRRNFYENPVEDAVVMVKDTASDTDTDTVQR